MHADKLQQGYFQGFLACRKVWGARVLDRSPKEFHEALPEIHSAGFVRVAKGRRAGSGKSLALGLVSLWG